MIIENNREPLLNQRSGRPLKNLDLFSIIRVAPLKLNHWRSNIIIQNSRYDNDFQEDKLPI